LDDDGDDEKTTRVDATRRTDPRASTIRDDSLERESDETTFFIDDEDANLY
jgi:hypothetical protein